jgi:hypothetical protein
MKRLLSIALLGAFAAVCATPVLAADNAQNDKMKACNAKAKGMKGDDYKAYMKTCLSDAPPAAPAATTSKSKMAACNTASKGKTGDDKKTFMSECMKKAA